MMQGEVEQVFIHDAVYDYIARLVKATREHDMLELGVSPRAVLAVVRMARAHAVLSERSYVVPEDVQAVFVDVCAHRLCLRPQARVEGISEQTLLEEILKQIKPTAALRRENA